MQCCIKIKSPHGGVLAIGDRQAFCLQKNKKNAILPGSMKVITIYGSKSDLPFMEPARTYFRENNVEHEEVVYSAHRDLPALIEYLKELEKNETKAVLLCVAGLSAALPGVVVMNTELPVIGIPVPCGPLNGVDALLAISQLPGGVPATTVGLHKKTPINAAMAAHRIIKLAE